MGKTPFFYDGIQKMGMKKGAFKKSERPMGECACVAGICQSAKHTYEKRLVSFETSLFPVYLGGDKRDRTADLLNAIQALSQIMFSMPPSCRRIMCAPTKKQYLFRKE